MLVGTQLSYWSDLAVGLGWVGLVMLLCRAGWRARAVAAVGRTALSNYLLQTVLCTTIFYGHGLGLFGARGARRPAADRGRDLDRPARLVGLVDPPLRGRPARVGVAPGGPGERGARPLAAVAR